MSDPSRLIKAALGKKILDTALKQSSRSTIESFKTGAVLFDDKTLEIVESGCSHAPLYTWLKDKRSVHAEDDILNKTVHIKDKSNLSVLIYTVGRAGNPTSSSKPCKGCAERLHSNNIERVYYLERCNDNSWSLNEERPMRILGRSIYER